ncbi:hypothetical protein I4U23_031566 [Adineta vaga]|nr:hypothetical protein I4U23_031566 [Adineta vaga]
MTIERGIYQGRILQCYTCNEGPECGILFSSRLNNNNTEHLFKSGHETLYSCSISISPESLITRDMILSNTRQSSSSQYCCKDNLCNSLPSPPLPAFTNLTCLVGHCSSPDNKCDDKIRIAYRSSAIESCSSIQPQTEVDVYKSYQKKCSPGLDSEPHSRIEAVITINSSCCYSWNCNQQFLSHGNGLNCYVYDSQSCATIIGLTGYDNNRNITYPSFTILTFVENCQNQPFGIVSYRDITFQGRINCCETNYCNTEDLEINLTPEITYISTTVTMEETTKVVMLNNKIDSNMLKMIIIISIIVISIGFIIIIYRFNCRRTQMRIRNYSFEEIPISSPLQPSSQPFIQTQYDLVETNNF